MPSPKDTQWAIHPLYANDEDPDQDREFVVRDLSEVADRLDWSDKDGSGELTSFQVVPLRPGDFAYQN